uniref:Chemokine interleukin-8-like domain-containing protein n=1 Tax=Astyanax mexicanus TaxID=7994 RepID=A0A3B1IVF8_ASTMX
MKILLILIMLLFICDIMMYVHALCLISAAPAVNQPDCCFKLTTMRIPQKMVKSYTQTSSDCALKAIVITTVKGRKFCVDPAAKWVSSHLKSLKNRTQ